MIGKKAYLSYAKSGSWIIKISRIEKEFEGYNEKVKYTGKVLYCSKDDNVVGETGFFYLYSYCNIYPADTPIEEIIMIENI